MIQQSRQAVTINKQRAKIKSAKLQSTAIARQEDKYHLKDSRPEFERGYRAAPIHTHNASVLLLAQFLLQAVI